MDSTRLLACFATEYARLSQVAGPADPAAPVPSCPGWSVADLLEHVGMVYLHKVECLRQGHHPDPWPPPEVAGEAPMHLLERSYAALAAELASREPTDPAFTWFTPDQSVGFWIRRMAHETVIHRVDAELAAGAPIQAIPGDLAQDGIDEVLVVCAQYGARTWPDEFVELLAGADGRSVRLEAAQRAWAVRLAPGTVEVRASNMDDAAATVAGEPGDLMRWLWNRAGDEVVHMTGDADLVTRLRSILAASTG